MEFPELKRLREVQAKESAIANLDEEWRKYWQQREDLQSQAAVQQQEVPAQGRLSVQNKIQRSNSGASRDKSSLPCEECFVWIPWM